MKKLFPLFLLLGLAVMADAHGISEADKQAIVDGGNLRYLFLGAIHMVTGYDHLLFLFGIIFYLSGMKDILKFVTVFTIGHSITLILATFLKITANYYLVDAVIALSVCYKAFDNLDGFRKYLKTASPPLLPMVFAFGLIHGFGLSTRLQQLPLPGHGLLTRILSFNVGVELGQLAALSAMVLLLAGWRRAESFRKMGGFANILLLAAGLGLFIYQMNGYFHGEDHHHDEEHHHEEAHGSGEDGHSHDQVEHAHGDGGNGASPVDTGSVQQSAGTRPVLGASQDPAHSPDTGQSPAAKKPKSANPKPHSHGKGIPHSH